MFPPALPFSVLHSQFSLSPLALKVQEDGECDELCSFSQVVSASPSSSHSSSAPAQIISTGSCPSGTEGSSVDFLWGPKPCQQTCTSMSFPWGHSLLWASMCSSKVSSMSWRWISAPLWASCGDSCLAMVCTTEATPVAPTRPNLCHIKTVH